MNTHMLRNCKHNQIADVIIKRVEILVMDNHALWNFSESILIDGMVKHN